MEQYQTVRSDILVIGGGMAGLAAAIAAAGKGADVLLVSWGEAGKSGATYYDVAEVGAMNAPDGCGDPTDNAEAYYNDIAAAALGMARLPLCRILAEQAAPTLAAVERLPGGYEIFHRENGVHKVFQACFSTKPRSHIFHDHFRPLLAVLLREAKRLGVRFFSGVSVAELFVRDGQCHGAMGIAEGGAQILFQAKAVVLAAGGASRIFARNMYPVDVMGSGYAMAHRAGARLTNMEFIQMGIGVAHPMINLFEHYLWDCYPIIRNASGKAFLADYLPVGVSVQDAIRDKGLHFPFSARDHSRYVEIAVQSELNAGNGSHNGNVYLDLNTPVLAELLQQQTNFSKMWGTTDRWYKEKGVNLLAQPLEAACFAHAINGGALIDERAMTSVTGLFAVGEVAAGPHGADRLGGNMSITTQVFGKIAGEESAQFAGAVTSLPDGSSFMREACGFYMGLSLPAQADKNEMLREIQTETDQSLLIVRHGERLSRYLETLTQLEGSLTGGKSALDCDAIHLYHLLETGKLIARAALERKESRGSHYRSDYPEISEAFAKNYVMQGAKGGFMEI